MPIMSVEIIKITNKRETQKNKKAKTNKQTKKQKRTRGTKAIMKAES